MRLVGHLACMGEGRFAYSVSKRNIRERGNLEDLDINIRIILK
jgi:hypothetical protein